MNTIWLHYRTWSRLSSEPCWLTTRLQCLRSRYHSTLCEITMQYLRQFTTTTTTAAAALVVVVVVVVGGRLMTRRPYRVRRDISNAVSGPPWEHWVGGSRCQRCRVELLQSRGTRSANARLTDQPPYLSSLLHPYSLRSANRNLLLIPPHTTNFSRRTFSFTAPTLWITNYLLVSGSPTLYIHSSVV